MGRPRFEQLSVRYARSQVGLTAPVHAAREPFGRRGVYVAFDERGFRYLAQDDEKGASAPSRVGLPADAIAKELALRSNRSNLFKAYVWLAAIALLISLVDATLFGATFLAAVVGGILVYSWAARLDRCPRQTQPHHRRASSRRHPVRPGRSTATKAATTPSLARDTRFTAPLRRGPLADGRARRATGASYPRRTVESREASYRQYAVVMPLDNCFDTHRDDDQNRWFARIANHAPATIAR